MEPAAWAQSLRLQVRSLLRRPDVERDLDEEIAYHVAQLTDAHLATGLGPAAARAAALRQFGGFARAKDACRDTWHVAFLDQLGDDVRLAGRVMRRTPGATAVMLLTLAIGIGTNTAVFSVINGLLLQPSYPDAGRIFWIMERSPRGDPSAVSTLNYLDWQTESQAFAEMASWGFGAATLSTGAAPIPLRATFASPGYFAVLGLRPSLGRTFVKGEEQPGQNHVAILSHRLWTSQFAADPHVIGTDIQIGGESYSVVGVLPDSASRGEWFWSEIWLPQTLEPANMTRDYKAVNVYGRLHPGVSAAQARAGMNAIADRLAGVYPTSNKGWGVIMTPYTDVLVNPRLRQSLYLLVIAVAAVLLIGCVNLANLLLAKAVAREREVSIRAALGGGRGRLLRQFATENLILAALGGILGLVTAHLLLLDLKRDLPVFAAANGSLPPADAIHVDGTVLLFTLVLSIVTSAIFGFLPARAATRIDLSRAMTDRGGTTDAARRTRHALVVSEIALAFVLMTTAGAVLQSFYQLSHVETGFNSDKVLTATLPLVPGQVLGRPEERHQYLTRVVEALSAVPGVRDVALTSALPLQGWGSELPCQADAEASVAPAERPTCFFKMISPSYFSTLGLRLRAGRGLQETDRPDAARVAVINETLARRYGGGQRAVGRRIVMPELITAGRVRLGADIAWQVVGVVADERVSALPDRRDSPGVYVPLAQSPTRRPALVIRAAMDPRGLEPALRGAVAAVNRDQPLADLRTLDAIKSDLLGSDRQRAWLLVAFAAVSLVLAAIGIYGVLSYSVLQRTRELGVRAAVGASAAQLVGLVLWDGLRLIGVGLALGLAGTLAVSALLRRLLFGGAALDARAILLAAVGVAGVALVACVLPAWRATKIDPLIALRSQ